MAVVKEMSKCPYCKEAILPTAVKCRHCYSEISKPANSIWKKYDKFRIGFLTGVLFSLVLLILFYQHFFTEG